MNFNLFASNTIRGVLLAIIGFLTQPSVLGILPAKVAAIITAIGALLGAIGLRNAIAGPTASAPNGPAAPGKP